LESVSDNASRNKSDNKKEVSNSPDQTTSQTNDKVTESTSANGHKTLLSDSPESTTIKINGKPLEKVNAPYNHNIYFSVKTSGKNYQNRLYLLMLTWFQVTDKDKVKYILLLLILCTATVFQLTIISDKASAGKPYLDTIKKAGILDL